MRLCGVYGPVRGVFQLRAGLVVSCLRYRVEGGLLYVSRLVVSCLRYRVEGGLLYVSRLVVSCLRYRVEGGLLYVSRSFYYGA